MQIDTKRNGGMIARLKLEPAQFAELEIPSHDKRKHPVQSFVLMPSLANWQGGVLPSKINPRSHDPENLKSHVAHSIKRTILEQPEEFSFANRGVTLVAHSLTYDRRSKIAEIHISDPETEGLIDGATSDTVIGETQKLLLGERVFADVTEEDMPEQLRKANLRVEVVVGLNDREKVGSMAEGRNTSVAVKGWSLADFRGSFDPIKEMLEAENSPFKEKIGYEENSGKSINILDVISLMTLFHREFNERDEFNQNRAPVSAYSSKGRMPQRFEDEDLKEGYLALLPILPDILSLYDYIHSTFDRAYDKAYKGNSRLGRRRGVESYVKENPHILPLTGTPTSYVISKGILFPTLNAFRALVTYFKSGEHKGEAKWVMDPKEFWDTHGHLLVATVMLELESIGGNPNQLGKRPSAYIAPYKDALDILHSSQERLAA